MLESTNEDRPFRSLSRPPRNRAGSLVAAVRQRLRAGPQARRVWWFSGILAGLSVLGYLVVSSTLGGVSGPAHVPWPLIALGFLAAESKVVVVHFQRESHSFSLSEFPVVIGLFVLPPNEYLLAVIAGSGIALVVAARQSATKVAFNLSNMALSAVIQLAVFRSIASVAGHPDQTDWIAAFAATLASCSVSAVTIAAAITLSGGASQFSKLPEMLRFGALVAVANTSLALLAVSIAWIDPGAAWLLVVPSITLFLAYRAYISEREKHERLELLYQSSRILQRSPAIDSALVALLHHLRDMFNAEVAEVVLYPRDGSGEGMRTTVRHDRPPEVMQTIQPGDDPLRALLDDEGHAVVATGAGSLGAGVHVRQAMVSPLVGEAGLLGALAVANRLTEGTSFDTSDLRLLETIGNQAAVALQNGRLEQSLAELSRLKEQLRYQAYHDPLTGLANRVLFTERVDGQLRSLPPGRLCAVLFLDLDDFKLVNDALGHAAGDRLLRAVADRVRSCIRSGDLAARLGGDEFAVLLVDGDGLERVTRVADRLIQSLAAAFPLESQELTIGGSIGIAVGLGPGQSADELLRNADVAMYTAKAGGKGKVAVFDPTVHAALVARHAMSAELSHGVGRGELEVYYQPIVHLASGQASGVEALVRWNHPTRGLVEPDAFIRLAEENGTILALGRWVLAQSCAQMAAWCRDLILPLDFSVSVNISPMQLQQPDFIEDVVAVLATTGLPPRRLTLELTETAMFQDTSGAIRKLEALRDLGVRVALDDFGTGYSSLGYLRRFPVDILKIARDFVAPADRPASEWAFAHAIVALGQTLGLRIVAEGIEDHGQAERLCELGCGYGQGFEFGRPAPARDVETTLAALGVPRGSVAAAPDPAAVPAAVAAPAGA